MPKSARSLTIGVVILGFAMGLPLPLVCQSDTLWAKALPEVEITGDLAVRSNRIGLVVLALDSMAHTHAALGNLGDALQQLGGVFVRSYGIGSLATLSVRGGSAAQTALVWNGLPLHTPMLGVQDMALVPVFLTEGISVQLGGSSSAWGSGAVSGEVQLFNNGRMAEGISPRLLICRGSFGQRQAGLSVGFGHKRWSSRSKVWYQDADNDFPYRPHPDLPVRRQSNARLVQSAFLQSMDWRIHDRHRLTGHLWWQHTNRQLPPTLVQNRSLATQADSAYRQVLTWESVRPDVSYGARIGYIHERITYRDPLMSLEAPGKFSVGSLDLFGHRQKGDAHRFSALVSMSRATAHTKNYPRQVVQWRHSMWVCWTMQSRGFHTQTDLRVEQARPYAVLPVPSLGVAYFGLPRWYFKAFTGRVYRLPTLNDRYWMPGGNADIRPETGWNGEVSAARLPEIDQTGFHARLTVYSRVVRDWILWALPKNQSYFAPLNVGLVHSRGLEIQSGYTRPYKAGLFIVEVGYQYNRSENLVSVHNPQITKGSQLFYVPMYQGNGRVSYRTRRLDILYGHTIVGSTTGLMGQVPSFNMGMIRASTLFERRGHRLRLFFQTDNVFNTPYQVVERRPMPGRAFRFGLDYRSHF